MNDLRTAFGLLTIFHVRYDAQRISARAFAYYPLVGLVVGAVLTVAQFLLRLVLPDLVAAVLVVALWAMLTGGLHLDGFTDACDGLFAAVSRERRLEILRDVHLGSFGAVGLILLLLTKAATLANATTLTPIFLAPILGRWAIVFAATFPLARRNGMAALFIAGLTRRVVFAATMIAILLSALFGVWGIGVFVTAFAIAALVARLAMNRLGGLTGDIYGMICESVETSVLIVGTILVW